MYEKVTLLNKEEHKNVLIKPLVDMSFAKELLVIPITYSEVQYLCSEFPIVFVEAETPYLAIVTGIGKEEGNLALDGNNQWRGGDYIPAYLRRYPFALIRNGAEEGTKALVGVDFDCDCFSEKEGERLFDEEGNPTEKLLGQIKFLEEYEKELAITAAIIKIVKSKGLLKGLEIGVTIDEKKKALRGFSAIDWELLYKMEDEVLLDWLRKGWVEIFAMHKGSLKNFNKLMKNL